MQMASEMYLIIEDLLQQVDKLSTVLLDAVTLQLMIYVT